MRNIEGFYAKIIKILAISAALLHLYAASFGVFPLRVMRSMHLIFLLPICFVLFPASKKSSAKKPSVFDLLLVVLSIIVGLYVMINYSYLQSRWTLTTPVLPIEVIFGVINILIILEATRRAVTPAMTILAGISLIYLYVGPNLSGLFYHSGFSIARIAEMMYLADDYGIYGMFTGISSTYIIIFVIFCSFVLEGGAGKMFNDLASALTGGSVGGSAKVAVVSSGLFGMMSGMAVANVYATGSFTIPLMKKMGYKPKFAAAVEAAASSGGQFMPPIMGVSAFIMAEMVGIPYIKIAITALIGAVLYFSCIFFAVHFEALKQGLKGLPKKDIPNIKHVIKKIYLFFPVIIICYYLVKGYSPLMAGVAGTVSTIPISFFSKDTFMGFKKILNALEKGVIKTVMIAVASACAGIIVSVVINTGLGVSFGSIVMHLTGGMLLPTLFFTMILAIILGTGLPTTAAYIISATLAAPILERIGIPMLTSHLFCFYFAIISGLTPPVAIVAYAAASIAGSSPTQTGFEAAKISVAAFLIPYIFTYDKAILMQGSFLEIFISTVSAMIGGYFLLLGVQGRYINRFFGVINRIVLIIFALLLFFLQRRFKVILLGLLFIKIIISYFIRKSKNKKTFIG